MMGGIGGVVGVGFSYCWVGFSCFVVGFGCCWWCCWVVISFWCLIFIIVWGI